MSADDDDKHWIAGLFYVNPSDKRILVPKRYGFGLGRTLNLGHPVSWLLLALVIGTAFVLHQSH